MAARPPFVGGWGRSPQCCRPWPHAAPWWAPCCCSNPAAELPLDVCRCASATPSELPRCAQLGAAPGGPRRVGDDDIDASSHIDPRAAVPPERRVCLSDRWRAFLTSGRAPLRASRPSVHVASASEHPGSHHVQNRTAAHALRGQSVGDTTHTPPHQRTSSRSDAIHEATVPPKSLPRIEFSTPWSRKLLPCSL